MSELESTQTLPRSEIAAYLREFANELDTGGSVDDRSERSETARENATGDSPNARGSPTTLDDSPTNAETSPTNAGRSPDDPIGTDDPDVDQSVRANEMDTSDAETTDTDAETTDTDVATDEPLQQKSRAPDDRVTLVVGDESATVNPPETPTFEIEVDSDSSLVGSSEQQSVSFELEWEVADVDEHDDIEIK